MGRVAHCDLMERGDFMIEERSEPADGEFLGVSPEGAPASGFSLEPQAPDASAPSSPEAVVDTPLPAEPLRSRLADDFESTQVPFIFWKVLKDPEDGAARAHVPGAPSLMYGLVVGVLCMVGIATLRLVTWPVDLEVHQGMAFYLGGLSFLVVGTLASFVLRATLGNVESADWHDDAFFVGVSLVHPVAAILCASLLGEMLGGIRMALGLAGLLLGVLTFRSVLIDIGTVKPGRATWVTVLVFALACAVSAPLGFLPLLHYVPFA